jgi:guanine nucleotide-binding protein G(i) subunit alpha
MGACLSAPAAPSEAELEEARRNQKIQEEQNAALHETSSTIKLLILGAGDSGKTTLRKQMRNIYSNGFPVSVRAEFARVIISNLLDGTLDVLGAMDGELRLKLQSPEAAKAQERMRALPSPKNVLSPETAEDLKLLLSDASFKQALDRRAEFNLQDCYLGFASQVFSYPAWGGASWVPSVQDCIASRVRTSGVLEESFVVDGIPFKMIDVGGQRAERKKWLGCFSDVSGVIFVASISEYNQQLFEDHAVNRVKESLQLFEQTCSAKLLEHMSFILFLNKKDIFDEKIKTIPLDSSLADLEGCPKGLVDAKTAASWLSQAFLARVPAGKKTFVHLTCATDSNNIKRVFQDCKNILLRESMVSAGFAVGGGQ